MQYHAVLCSKPCAESVCVSITGMYEHGNNGAAGFQLLEGTHRKFYWWYCGCLCLWNREVRAELKLNMWTRNRGRTSQYKKRQFSPAQPNSNDRKNRKDPPGNGEQEQIYCKVPSTVSTVVDEKVVW